MNKVQGAAVYAWGAIRLLRPTHLMKNGLIWLPIFFSHRLLEWETFFAAAMAFLSFSLAASSVYVFNDICDAGKDRLHPKKCRRPIASGLIPIPVAAGVWIVMIAGAILLNIFFSARRNGVMLSLILLLVYLVLNVGYSIKWKNIPIVDVAILSSGFLIRVLYGGEFYSIQTSPWLFLTVFSISVFMGLGKRRTELKQLGREGRTRTVLKSYTADFLDKNMYLAASLGIVFYSLWSMSVHAGVKVIWSVPLVAFCFMRYSYVIETKDSNGDPVSLILKDLPLLLLGSVAALFLFVAFYGTALYRILFS